MARTHPQIRVDASSAECLVFTEKEGLLSSVAHDLKIRVAKFEMTWDGATLTASFDPRSLRVVNALKGGREDPEALSDADKAKIEKSIVGDVLHAKRHPTIEFRSSEVVADDKGFRIQGDLTLHGVTRRISPKASLRGERWSAQVTIHQPDHDIKPFTAMLGTLKVKPKLRVRISVPAADVPSDPFEA